MVSFCWSNGSTLHSDCSIFLRPQAKGEDKREKKEKNKI
jgi:hypothetical protein